MEWFTAEKYHEILEEIKQINIISLSISIISVIMFQSLIVNFYKLLSQNLKDKEKDSEDGFHFIRRIQHFTTSLFIIILSCNLPLICSQIALLLGTLFLFIVYIIRMIFPVFNEYFIKNYGELLRKSEHYGQIGSFYFLLGLTFVIFLFEIRIFYLSCIILGVGDPTAGIIGKLIKSPIIYSNKNISGSLGSALCSLISIFILSFFIVEIKMLFNIDNFAFVSFFICLVSEVLPTIFNDNLTIPLYSAILYKLYL